MIRYIINDESPVSKDPKKYPLLTTSKEHNEPVPDLEKVWPKCISFSDGSFSPLFSGGILTSGEICAIASQIAQEILALCHGQKVLLVQILEGALPFCRLICKQLNTLKASGSLSLDVASIKVSSYLEGTQAYSHRVSKPLQALDGVIIGSLDEYDRVILCDDLIDAGNTFAWLVNDYLPSFGPKELSAYFLVEKARKRSHLVDATLEKSDVVFGKRVPDEWLVGFGLDIRLPGNDDQKPLHLFRKELHGGIYAFNSSIEKKLIQEYQEQGEKLLKQIQPYVSDS